MSEERAEYVKQSTPEDEHKRIGARLRELRKGRKLMLRSTSEATGISMSFLSRIERGIAAPSPDTLKRLAAFYGVSAGEMSARTTPEKREMSVQLDHRTSLPSGGTRRASKVGDEFGSTGEVVEGVWHTSASSNTCAHPVAQPAVSTPPLAAMGDRFGTDVVLEARNGTLATTPEGIAEHSEWRLKMTTVNDLLNGLQQHITAIETENAELKELLSDVGQSSRAILDAINRYNNAQQSMVMRPAEVVPAVPDAPELEAVPELEAKPEPEAPEAPAITPHPKAKLPKVATTQRHYSDDDVEEWVKRTRAGEVPSDIAREFNTTGWVISQAIKLYYEHNSQAQRCTRCDLIIGTEDEGTAPGRDGLCGYCVEELAQREKGA